MRRKALAICCLAAIPTVMPVMAQDLPSARPQLCLYADQTYSPGSTVRFGWSTVQCSTSGAWEPAEGVGTTCIYAGQPYTTGAVIAGAVEGTTRVCTDAGDWALPSELSTSQAVDPSEQP